MSDHVVVRGAQIADAGDLARIFVGAGLCTTEGLEPRLRRSLSASPETCFVAERDANVIGGVIATFNGFHVFLSHIGVDSTHRGRGTGGMLHAAVASAAHQLGALGIIADSRLSAVPFFYELGYRIPGAVFLIRDPAATTARSS